MSDICELDFLDGEAIVLEVEKYPCLYNVNSSSKFDRGTKLEAWDRVFSAVVGPDKWEALSQAAQIAVGREIQRRWKNMRDAYCRSLRDLRRKRRDNGKYSTNRKPYIYHKQMSFLKEALESRSEKESWDDNATVYEFIVATDLLEENQINTVEPKVNEDPLPAEDRKIFMKVSKRQRQDPPEPEHHPIVTLSATPNHQNNCCTSDKKDHDEMFLLSLLPHFNKLSMDDKLDFQIKTLQLIQSYGRSNQKQ